MKRSGIRTRASAHGRRRARRRAGLPAWLTVLLFVAVLAAGLWIVLAGRLAGVTAPGPAPTLATGSVSVTSATPSTARPDSPTAARSATAVPTTSTTPTRAAEGDAATVLRVVDGDTIDVQRAGERVRVRLLNIDTPETKAPGQPVECLGPQASAFTAKALPVGAAVTLRYDRERFDRYGRTLAGVFVGERFVNREIVAAGLAEPVTVGSNRRFRSDMDAAYAEARRAHRGFFDPASRCPAPTPR